VPPRCCPVITNTAETLRGKASIGMVIDDHHRSRSMSRDAVGYWWWDASSVRRDSAVLMIVGQHAVMPGCRDVCLCSGLPLSL
jgi:hypothetical protein